MISVLFYFVKMNHIFTDSARGSVWDDICSKVLFLALTLGHMQEQEKLNVEKCKHLLLFM